MLPANFRSRPYVSDDGWQATATPKRLRRGPNGSVNALKRADGWHPCGRFDARTAALTPERARRRVNSKARDDADPQAGAPTPGKPPRHVNGRVPCATPVRMHRRQTGLMRRVWLKHDASTRFRVYKFGLSLTAWNQSFKILLKSLERNNQLYRCFFLKVSLSRIIYYETVINYLKRVPKFIMAWLNELTSSIKRFQLIKLRVSYNSFCTPCICIY